MTIIIFLLVLIFSAILHEIAHGAVAEYFGDYTARDEGRITLNPIPHIDPMFTILVPALLVMSGSPIIFGAAKPVPVNYNNLRNFRWGVFWVSIAGILTNLLIAFLIALPVRFLELSSNLETIFIAIAQINVMLAIINMIPIPPIDGSKVVASLLGESAIIKLMSHEGRGILGVLPYFILIYFLFMTRAFDAVLMPVANFFFKIFGIPGF
jgi:Zn-dependent protease